MLMTWGCYVKTTGVVILIVLCWELQCNHTFYTLSTVVAKCSTLVEVSQKPSLQLSHKYELSGKPGQCIFAVENLQMSSGLLLHINTQVPAVWADTHIIYSHIYVVCIKYKTKDMNTLFITCMYVHD